MINKKNHFVCIVCCMRCATRLASAGGNAMKCTDGHSYIICENSNRDTWWTITMQMINVKWSGWSCRKASSFGSSFFSAKISISSIHIRMYCFRILSIGLTPLTDSFRAPHQPVLPCPKEFIRNQPDLRHNLIKNSNFFACIDFRIF